jgi:hypothetical protein
MNKFLLIVISVVLFVALAKVIFPSLFISFQFAPEQIVFIAQVIGLIMMLVNGTFTDTLYFKVSILIFIIILVGAAMKILHYAGADQTILISLPIIPLIYLIHFVLKKEKGHLDILKLLTVFALFIIPPLLMLHIISRDYTNSVRIFNQVIFWLTFVDFLAMGLSKGTLFRE